MGEKETKKEKSIISDGKAALVILITVFLASAIITAEMLIVKNKRNEVNLMLATKQERQLKPVEEQPVVQQNEETSVTKNETSKNEMDELSAKIRKDEAKKAKEATQADENTTAAEEKKQELKLENYKGEWFKTKKDYEALKQNLNPDSLKITNVKDDNITFDFYVTKVGNFNNVSVSVEGGYGTFVANSDNAVSTDKTKAKIDGSVKLFDDGITLEIFDSNIESITSGTQFNFKYKK